MTSLPTRGPAFRMILPVAVLLALVGAVTWVTQYLPNYRSARPQGPPAKDNERTTPVEAPATTAPPCQFFPAKLSCGVLGPGERREEEFTVWSATRSKLDLAFPATQNDPLEIRSFKPLSDERLQAWRDKIKEQTGGSARVQCAYSLRVRVHEPKMDLGFFYHPLRLTLDGVPVKDNVPAVVGTIKADIIVGGPEDQNSVNFGSFRSEDKAKKEVPVWSDAKTILEKHRHYPTGLKVNLTRIDQESTSKRTKWLLEVEVRPGAYYGPFTDDCAIWLRITSPTPRLVRIPITGNAGS